MSVFPPTSMTLLQKLAVEATGGNEASWVRFFGLYTPAMRRVIELNDHTHDPDDVIQDVYVKLVEILEKNQYDADKARFRTFLAMLIRRQLISLYRKEQAHGGNATISLDAMQEPDESGRAASAHIAADLSIPATQADEIDLTWAKAKHEAAVEHVLTKTALSAQTKAVYRAYVLENRPADQVAAEFGIAENLVFQIKFRVDKAISVIEEEYADEKS